MWLEDRALERQAMGGFIRLAWRGDALKTRCRKLDTAEGIRDVLQFATAAIQFPRHRMDGPDVKWR
jgi:hypothetical protein